MGQKVNPNCFRLCVINTWASSWYSVKNDYKIKLHQDIKIRNMIVNKFKFAGIAKINIDRLINKLIVSIYSSKPGIIIGKKGSDIVKIRKCISNIVKDNVIIISITELKKVETCPKLVASSIAEQLEKRGSFRKIAKRAISSAKKVGVRGIKIGMKGRLGGAEIARHEWYKDGKIPLHTLRYNVEYSMVEARTIYGVIGVKVWIYIN